MVFQEERNALTRRRRGGRNSPCRSLAAVPPLKRLTVCQGSIPTEFTQASTPCLPGRGGSPFLSSCVPYVIYGTYCF